MMLRVSVQKAGGVSFMIREMKNRLKRLNSDGVNINRYLSD